MKHAERNSIITLIIGNILLFIGLATNTLEVLICAAFFYCTSVIIDSLVSIFSKEESEDAKEN